MSCPYAACSTLTVKLAVKLKALKFKVTCKGFKLCTEQKKVRNCCPKVFKSFLKGEKFIWFEKIVYVQETISKELRRPLVWLVQDETWCVFKGRYYFCSFSSHLLQLQKSLSCVSAVISLLIDCICVLDSWLDNVGLLKASSLVWRVKQFRKILRKRLSKARRQGLKITLCSCSDVGQPNWSCFRASELWGSQGKDQEGHVDEPGEDEEAEGLV